MASYEFVTIWKVEAPIEKVWKEIYYTEHWPEWWKGVIKVVELKEGDELGVGSIRRYTWRTKLPYKLIFDIETVRVEPMSYLEGRARGELDGKGIWRLSSDGEITIARYDWLVATTKTWMNLLAPLAKPLFEWNHKVVMSWGAESLAKRLGVKVFEEQ
jgi:hypothetical protein